MFDPLFFMVTFWQMFRLWEVRLDDGGYAREVYGEDYVDVYALNRLHFKAASNITCNNVRNPGFRRLLHASGLECQYHST